MTRVTKADLGTVVLRQVEEIRQLRARIRQLEIEPGVLGDGYGGRGQQYAARPVPKDAKLREWLREAACRMACEGDFETAEGVEHTKLAVPRYNDELPPGTDAIIIRYSYSNEWGTNVSAFWPAVKV